MLANTSKCHVQQQLIKPISWIIKLMIIIIIIWGSLWKSRNPDFRHVWKGGPSSISWHHFQGIRGTPGPLGKFPEARSCAQARYLSHIFLRRTLGMHKDTQGRPKAAQVHPKGAQGHSTEAREHSKGAQVRPKGIRRGSQSSPRAPQREPKGGKGSPSTQNI
jgi:hypothetical protein